MSEQQQPANALPVAGVVRNTGAVIPDRLYIRCPGQPKTQTRKWASAAVREARYLSPKLSGRAAEGIKSYYGDGFFGVRWDRPYLWWQEGGIRPFTMRTLAGKAQPMSEAVLTPIGWRKMETLSVGDQVIGSNGDPTSILDVFPQGMLECYRVRFSDGTSTRCSADHLWQVRRGRQGDGRWEVHTTEYLSTRLGAGWRVPLVQPVELEQVVLPVDPYLVGVLLGDGCLTGSSPAFSAVEPAVPEQVQQVLPDGLTMQKSGSSHSWFLTSGARGTRSNPLSVALRSIGINGLYSWEKFVPAIYLAGAAQNRLSLLQGLLDSDGSCQVGGFVRFHSSSLMLAENVADLVRGLGGTASVSSDQGGDRQGRLGHRPMNAVAIKVPDGMDPFRADQPRHDRYLNAPRRRAPNGKTIVSIEPEGLEEMQCILVNAPDHLYVTEGYTLTHNTIPMWIDDWTGAEHRANPNAPTRITATGRRQILIFRKAAPIGSRKRVAVRDAQGRLQRWRDVPRSYPGAPGRISHREWHPVAGNTGRISRMISRPHMGVRWRHPGLVPREFMQYALQQVAQNAGLPDIQVYATYRRR